MSIILSIKTFLSISFNFVHFIEGKSKVFIGEVRTSENSLHVPVLYLPITETSIYKLLEELLCKYN